MKVAIFVLALIAIAAHGAPNKEGEDERINTLNEKLNQMVSQQQADEDTQIEALLERAVNQVFESQQELIQSLVAQM